MKTNFTNRVLIIGGGIIGAACAYNLAKQGAEVTLLDARTPSSGASGASDGAVSVASKKSGAMMALALEGQAEYVRLRNEGILSGIYKDRSTFIVARTSEEQTVLERRSKTLGSVGVQTNLLGQAEACSRIPMLTNHTKVALEIPREGHALGYQVVDRFIHSFGCKIRRDCPVEGLVPGSDGHIKAVKTPQGNIETDSVIIAAGLDSNKLLGSPILKPNRGQLIITQRMGPSSGQHFDGHILSAAYLVSKGASVSAEMGRPKVGTSIDPLQTGQMLIGGTREGPGDPKTNEFETIRDILSSAISLCPGLSNSRILKAFAGLRAYSPDGLPLIGRHPTLENVWIATGLEGDGICLGPLTGRVIADLVMGRPEPASIQPFNPARFSQLGVAA